MLDRVTRKGYVVETSSLKGFLSLYLISRLKPMRRRSLRWLSEFDRHQTWLAQIQAIAARDYDLAVEATRCLEMVRGYGDTHDRAVRKYETIMSALPALVGQSGGAAQLDVLRKAASADESGDALNRKLADLSGVASRSMAVAG